MNKCTYVFDYDGYKFDCSNNNDTEVYNSGATRGLYLMWMEQPLNWMSRSIKNYLGRSDRKVGPEAPCVTT